MAIQKTTLSRPFVGTCRTIALASICATALGTSTPATAAAAPRPNPAPVAAATLSFVATSEPTRLVQSTGNLYWTVNQPNEFGPSSASVYRTSKSATPGQESLMYRETSGNSILFGAVTYAKVAGGWRHYIVVSTNGVSRIKRLPTAVGGAAVTIATAPRLIGNGDLVTDGASLFWSDYAGVRAVPIGGGAVRTLASESSPRPRRVGLDAQNVYYVSGNRVRTVPKAGGVARTVVTAPNPVTALHVRPSSFFPIPTIVYWADSHARVNSYTMGGRVRTYQAPIAGYYTTSVSFDGTRVLWANCSTNGLRCRVRQYPGGDIVPTTVGTYAHDIQGDSTATFFGISKGVQRYRR